LLWLNAFLAEKQRLRQDTREETSLKFQGITFHAEQKNACGRILWRKRA